MVLFSANTFAAVPALSCPSVSAIKQAPGSQGGFVYTALLPDGKQWIGKNIQAEAGDLKRVKFKEACIINVKNYVACDYAIPKRTGGMRMTLESAATIEPIGVTWNDQHQPDGGILPRCASRKASACTFAIK
ncbi:hypothetical protein BRCH_02752c [Candidatus Burkholderia brachyanthoides]|nr:hypothetical protein BRCH_02752c [Candidatus Burkholderia brachyanthoides]